MLVGGRSPLGLLKESDIVLIVLVVLVGMSTVSSLYLSNAQLAVER